MSPTDTQERFMALWTAAQASVSNYIHGLVRNPSDAKDVLQETALVLFRRFEEYDSSRPFIGWALGVARLQALGHHRDRNRSLVVFDDEVLDQITENWSALAQTSSERAIFLESCLDRLPQKSRQLVTLRYHEELTAEDIASRLGSKGAAIRVALQRIREQLHACVSQKLNQPQSV
ncbi:MAG: sigma-70 family RNA polymerase sigma factor [Verrucomicrobiota bacterium]